MRCLPDLFGRRGAAAALLLAACLAVPAPARAEVSAEVDAFGNYVRTVLVAGGSARRVKIWSPYRSRPSPLMLNPDGDTRGDLWPAIQESPVTREPWVVWSRPDGSDFDLVWSRFRDRAWATVASLLPLDSAEPDRDPVLRFDDTGRAYVAWRRGGSRGRIYVSLFLTTRWMMPLQVSDAGEDAGPPTLEILPERQIRITYGTAAGTVTKIVRANSGATITDDINPFDSFSVTPGPTH